MTRLVKGLPKAIHTPLWKVHTRKQTAGSHQKNPFLGICSDQPAVCFRGCSNDGVWKNHIWHACFGFNHGLPWSLSAKMALISWDIFVGVVRTKESEAFEKLFFVQFAPEQILIPMLLSSSRWKMICYDLVFLPWSIHVVGDGDKFLKPITGVIKWHPFWRKWTNANVWYVDIYIYILILRDFPPKKTSASYTLVS